MPERSLIHFINLIHLIADVKFAQINKARKGRLVGQKKAVMS